MNELCAYCSEYAPGVKCEYDGKCNQEAVARRRDRLKSGRHTQSDVLEWMKRAIENDRRSRR